MNIRQLEAFRAFMATGTVTLAAEQLRISQPAVSQLIVQLERSCGFALFSRETGRLKPTREADVLLAEVTSLFAGVQRVKRVAGLLRDHQWGSVSVAAFLGISRSIMPAIISSHSLAHPEVRFHLEVMRSRHLIDAVAARQFDFGLSHLPGDREEVESVHLHSFQAVCVLPARHRLAGAAVIKAQDLDGEKFISLGSQDASVSVINATFDNLGVQRRIQIETGQSEVACTFVANGLGVAIVDPLTVYNYRDERVVVRPFVPALEFSVWLILCKQRELTIVASDFVIFLRDRLSEYVTALSSAIDRPPE